MIKFMKRLWKDRGGNALLLAGAAMPIVVGAAGLATDTIQWTLWKRELQRAADSAAFAGVYAIAQDATVTTAVDADLVRNHKTGVALMAGYPEIAYPTSADWENGVQVTIAIQKALGFSSLFMSGPPTILASATAAMVDDGNYCVVALESSTATGITIGGSSSANLGCGAISNSKSQTASVSTNGNAYNFVADPVAAVGGMPSSITGVTTLLPHHMAMKDPFAGDYSTGIPAGMNCQNFQQHSYNVGTGQSAVKHLTPGCFTGFAPNGSDTYHMDPGVYYLNNTGFTLNGNDTLIGTGVTIILTGTSPGSISVNGNSSVQLSAPTTGAYANMLFIQALNATANNVNNINGSAASSYDGAIYFPKGQITFDGSSGSITKCAMVVAKQVVFSGNTNLQNDTTGCVADTTVPGKMIRLVA
jgi:Flp pilus assembly protein TadG